MKTISGDLDHRYTIVVYLIRENRPKYWSFHCPRCGEKLLELDGQMAYMADLAFGEAIRSVNRVRCNSRTCGGRIWYEFSLK